MEKKTKDTTFRFMWGQQQSAMFAEYMLLNFSEKNDEFSITEGVDNVIREHNAGNSYIYFSEGAIERSYENANRYFNIKESEKILETIDELVFDSTEFYRGLRGRSYENISKQELIDIFEQYKHYFLFGQKLYRASDPSATKKVQDKILEILESYVKDDNLIDEFTLLTTPTVLDRTQLELVDLYNCIQDQRISDEHLLDLALKYPANYANSWHDKEIVVYLRKRIAETDLEELSSQIRIIQEDKEELKKQQEEHLEKYSNEELDRLSAILRRLATQRFELKHSWAGGETLALDFLHYLASLVDMDIQDFMESYNFTDVSNYLQNNVTLTEEEIGERKDYSIIHYQNDTLKYLYGQEARSYFLDLYSPDQEVSELKGMVASAGSATGIVRVVRVGDLTQFIEDQKAFQEGEILVTTMTSPIMMPIARKAAAIVTNEGGITSHAAVISREFKIPCVVGTHDATNVFKTGDRVTVDAITGLVTKQ